MLSPGGRDEGAVSAAQINGVSVLAGLLILKAGRRRRRRGICRSGRRTHVSSCALASRRGRAIQQHPCDMSGKPLTKAQPTVRANVFLLAPDRSHRRRAGDFENENIDHCASAACPCEMRCGRRHLDIQIIRAVPFMRHIPHDERVIKLDASLWELLFVCEIA